MKKLRHVLSLSIILLFGLTSLCQAGRYYGHGYRHYGHRYDHSTYYNGHRSRHYDSDRLWVYLGIGILSGLVVGSIVSAAPRQRTVIYDEHSFAPVSYRSPRVVVRTPPEIIIRQEVYMPVEPVLERVATTPSLLNLRAIPDGEADIIGRLERGTMVDVIGAAPDWLYIKTESGEYGWIMQRYTRPAETPVG